MTGPEILILFVYIILVMQIFFSSYRLGTAMRKLKEAITRSEITQRQTLRLLRDIEQRRLHDDQSR